MNFSRILETGASTSVENEATKKPEVPEKLEDEKVEKEDPNLTQSQYTRRKQGNHREGRVSISNEEQETINIAQELHNIKKRQQN